MNTNVLKGEIIAKFGSVKALANKLGWKPDKLSRILSGRQKLNLDEMAEIANALCVVNPDELVRVFCLL